MIRKLIFGVFLFALINPVRSQITLGYNQGYLRDIITTDSSIFAIHINSSQDTSDYTNTKDFLIIYKFDMNLNMVDSIILDSLHIAKCIEKDGSIFIAATRVYPDTFTCSMNLFHLNQNLDILNHREFKETNVSFFASDFIFSNDSIRIFVLEDRTMSTGIRYSKEFLIDTTFVDLDSVSCGIPAGTMVFYYKNAISVNNKRIYSGNLDISNFQPPIYQIFSDNGTCNQITPFSLWYNYIYSENNFELMRGHSNFLLKDNHSFFISVAGEEDFGSFDSFTGILKMDTLFNPIDYYIHQPTAIEENLVPFKNKSILHFDDKIVLASNTKMKAWLSNPPYEQNEIRIDLLDTNLNFISGINLNPMPWIGRPYFGSMVELLPDGGILLGGNFGSLTGNDPGLAFLIKFPNVSDMLAVQENNFSSESLLVYPNPVTDILKISGQNLSLNSEIRIFDCLGKLMMTREYDVNGYSVAELSSGIYFIQIMNEGMNVSMKFIKE